MRVLAGIVMMGSIASAVAGGSFTAPPSLNGDSLASGYMPHVQIVAGAFDDQGPGGSAPAGGWSVARNRWMFDPGLGRDTETSLAIDRRDPDRVLVAWQEDIT